MLLDRRSINLGKTWEDPEVTCMHLGDVKGSWGKGNLGQTGTQTEHPRSPTHACTCQQRREPHWLELSITSVLAQADTKLHKAASPGEVRLENKKIYLKQDWAETSVMHHTWRRPSSHPSPGMIPDRKVKNSNNTCKVKESRVQDCYIIKSQGLAITKLQAMEKTERCN